MARSRALAHPGRVTGDPIARAVRRRDVRALARAFFGVELTRGQVEIVRVVAFREHRRVIINAHTRYGKTWSVALGICLRILLDRAPLRIRFIGPTKHQASILKEYIADLVQRCTELQRLVQMDDVEGAERLRKEVSKTRWTFRDGKDLRVFTAENKGRSLMGFGGDIIVKDESCLIDPEADAKIHRMVLDNPEAVLIEMSNPWHAGGAYYRHWNDPKWHRIHIGWRQGVEEGRISLEDVEELRGEYTPTEWQVLMESEFPDAGEDQLIPFSWIVRAIGLDALTPESDGVMQHGIQYGLDVAKDGGDWNVLTRVRWFDVDGVRHYEEDWQQHWGEGDTMVTAARAAREMEPGAHVTVDCIGLGKGVGDRLRELGFNVTEFQASERARDEKRFLNRGSEAYFNLRALLEHERLHLKASRELKTDLTKPKWNTDRGRIHVEKNPENGKSPDHGDSLVMALLTPGSPARTVRQGERRVPRTFTPGELYRK